MRIQDQQSATGLESSANEFVEAVVIVVMEVEANSENLFVSITDDQRSMVMLISSHRYYLSHKGPMKKDFGPDVSVRGVGLAGKLGQRPEGEWTFVLSVTHLDDV
jgi:hypothetical protein